MTDTCLYGKESDITKMFAVMVGAGNADERLAIGASDTVVYEMAFRFGRADIVVFHINGSASVIEVKDGTKGYSHVVSGLGQAGLYAAQLAEKRVLTKVRRCLLWTSTGSVVCDGLIEVMCEQAGAMALPWGSLDSHIDALVRNGHWTRESKNG